MRQILLNNLNRQYQAMRNEILEAVTKTLDSGWYVLGQEVSLFEQEFAKYCGTQFCTTVANGTDALEISLKAVGVMPSDEVITAANAGMYSTTAILACGAIPVFADIQSAGYNICPKDVLQKITPKTKAIIVTHLFGQLADIEELAQLANEKNIALIEDCAQAHGAEINGKKAGSWGVCAAFSFYPTKNLGALGDGGAIVSNSEEILESVKSLRQYGWSKKYHVSRSGGKNSRLDELQAAILRVKLKKLDELNSSRVEIAERYNNEINHPLIQTPKIQVRSSCVSHLYVIRCEQRQKLMQHLSERGISTEVHYPVLDYRQSTLEKEHKDTLLPNSEAACSQILTLPSYPELKKDEVQYICEAINSWI